MKRLFGEESSAKKSVPNLKADRRAQTMCAPNPRKRALVVGGLFLLLAVINEWTQKLPPLNRIIIESPGVCAYNWPGYIDLDGEDAICSFLDGIYTMQQTKANEMH